LIRTLSNIAAGKAYSGSSEAIHTLLKMELATYNGESYSITEDGKIFLEAYSEKRGDILHKYLLRLPEYERVANAYFGGFTTIKSIAEETGLNALVVDISLRLLNEVLYLSPAKQREIYSLFMDKIIETYRKISRNMRSKYVPIVEVRKCIIKELNLSSKVFEELLAKFVDENRENVILAPAPLFDKNSSRAVSVRGRKYVYIFIKSGKW